MTGQSGHLPKTESSHHEAPLKVKIVDVLQLHFWITLNAGVFMCVL